MEGRNINFKPINDNIAGKFGYKRNDVNRAVYLAYLFIYVE